MCHTQSLPIRAVAVLSPAPIRRSRARKSAQQQSNPRPDDAQPAYQPNISPGPAQRPKHAPAQFRFEKRHHQLAPSVGTTVPLQVKTDHLVTDGINSEHKQEQRQSAKVQDPPGDADNRPPDTLEAMQANTNEVEALRLVNQRLIGELKQLTRQIQHPRDTRKTQEGHNFPPHEGKHNIDIPRGAETEAESSRARGMDHNQPQERKATKQCSEDVSGTKNCITLS